MHFIILLSFSTLLLGQNVDITIKNALVSGNSISWEVHIQPTDDWSDSTESGSQALGDCSWYFSYNPDALSNPSIVLEGDAVNPSENYVSTTEIRGVGSASRVFIDTDFTLNLDQGKMGETLSQGTDYHLYTIKMDIDNSNLESDIYWDELNTGVFTSFDDAIIETYVGNGDITLIDISPSYIIQVSSLTSDGSYKAGDTLDILIQFSESIFVVGMPYLELETGNTNQMAEYSSGSGSDSLIFSYIIQPGDSSLDLDYSSANALTLNGGSIKDGTNHNADLLLAIPGEAYSLAANKDIIIDTIIPLFVNGIIASNNT
ncbi:MAG: hypothetical protein KAI81_08570, partial [Candidatus Marinimicrobia bacterium]|nr:hypothetical protein [Candidatus Neomarinimicrobiota bacterium]